jgi:membrane protein required for colicin V production
MAPPARDRCAMADLPINPVDVLVGLVLILSGLLAFSRGAVRETLGVGSWIGAALATIYGFNYVRPFAHRWIESQLVADAATGFAIFVVALIILMIISQLISRRIQGSRLGSVDRTIGFLFGLVRGAVLLCLAYMMFLWAIAEDDRPAWVAKARTMPYITMGAEAIRSIVPDQLEKRAEKTVRQDAEKTDEALKALRAFETLRNSGTASKKSADGD